MKFAERISDGLELLPEATLEESARPPRRGKFSWRRPLAMAACLCALFLGIVLWRSGASRSGGHDFLVKTYAMEAGPDGSVELVEADLLDQPDVWGGCVLEGRTYINIGLRFSGEDIAQVEFSTAEGAFATQDTTGLVLGEDTAYMVTGSDHRLVMAGDSFTLAGPVLTLEGPAMPEGMLIFWTQEGNVMNALPESISITATATFVDGSTQKVELELSQEMMKALEELRKGGGEEAGGGEDSRLEVQELPEGSSDRPLLPQLPDWNPAASDEG